MLSNLFHDIYLQYFVVLILLVLQRPLSEYHARQNLIPSALDFPVPVQIAHEYLAVGSNQQRAQGAVGRLHKAMPRKLVRGHHRSYHGQSTNHFQLDPY